MGLNPNNKDSVGILFLKSLNKEGNSGENSERKEQEEN